MERGQKGRILTLPPEQEGQTCRFVASHQSVAPAPEFGGVLQTGITSLPVGGSPIGTGESPVLPAGGCAALPGAVSRYAKVASAILFSTAVSKISYKIIPE